MQMRPRQVVSVLKKMIPAQKPVLMVGRPGIGKTSMCEQLAEELNMQLLVWHPVTMERVDIVGVPMTFAGKGGETIADFLPFEDWRKICTTKKPTLLVLDDLGQAPTDVQGALMQMILLREVNGRKISDKVTIIAATNRKKDKAGVQGMISPLLDRFSMVIEVEFNLDDWAAWMVKKKYDPTLVAFNRWRPKLMLEAVPSGEMEKTPTPRSVAEVGELLRIGLEDKDSLSACAGSGWAGEYFSFRKVVSKLPDRERIWKSPKDAPVPEGADVLYALMAHLSHYCEEENIDSLMTYLERCDPAFAVACLVDCTARLEALVLNPKFAKWVKKNKTIFGEF